jgi:atypical dual specificity phosphatase
VRTGSFSLPSPDALAQDLATDAPLPPPLSLSATQAIHKFNPQAVPKVAEVKAVTPPPVRPTPPVVQTPVVAAVVTPRPVTPTPAAPAPQPPFKANTPNLDSTRKLAALPSTSRYGVEQAAAVGNVFFHDSSAPRGFHWIVPGKLAGCPAPGVTSPIEYDLSLLSKTGITKLVTLTEVDLDQGALHKAGLSNLHLPIFDRESPSINQTHMLLVRMQKFIDAGEKLAVHCKAGLGRTGTILAAWLIREGGLSADDAIARLRRINPGYIQSQDQEDFLHSYEADLMHRLM